MTVERALSCVVRLVKAWQAEPKEPGASPVLASQIPAKYADEWLFLKLTLKRACTLDFVHWNVEGWQIILVHGHLSARPC